MSKSSFNLLLLTVASLTAAAGVRAGGLRMGKPEWGYEMHEDIVSLQDDYHSVRSDAERAPTQIQYFIQDVSRDLRFLAADVRADARIATRYFTGMFMNATDLERAGGDPETSPGASHT